MSNNISNQFQLTVGNQTPITITTDGYNWYDSTGTILRNDLVLPVDGVISFKPLDFGNARLNFLNGASFEDILTFENIFKINQFADNTVIDIYYPDRISLLKTAILLKPYWYNLYDFGEILNDYIIPNNYYLYYESNPVKAKLDYQALIQKANSGKIKVQKEPIIYDIRKDQTTTIGELHYNTEADFRSIFTTDAGDKVFKNEILQSNNRINYNLGSTPKQFTVSFDYKAGGGSGADGAYFYFFAKGTISPNRVDQWLNQGCNTYECLEYDQNDNCIRYGNCIDYNILRDTFPNGKYINERDQDGYRIHFDEFVDNEQLAVSWAGYNGGGDLIYSLGTVNDNPLGLNFADGTWRNIIIKFDQGKFEVYIFKTLVLTCIDSNYNNRDKSGNNFGLGGYVGGANNYHYFKNFRFYDYLRD